ncbi:hypothetical protein BD413DRAFT_552623, partial [Trametes elegans]
MKPSNALRLVGLLSAPVSTWSGESMPPLDENRHSARASDRDQLRTTALASHCNRLLVSNKTTTECILPRNCGGILVQCDRCEIVLMCCSSPCPITKKAVSTECLRTAATEWGVPQDGVRGYGGVLPHPQRRCAAHGAVWMSSAQSA